MLPGRHMMNAGPNAGQCRSYGLVYDGPYVQHWHEHAGHHSHPLSSVMGVTLTMAIGGRHANNLIMDSCYWQ